MLLIPPVGNLTGKKIYSNREERVFASANMCSSLIKLPTFSDESATFKRYS